MTSRAAMELTRPMPIFQLKPSGAITGSTVRPIVPAKLSAIWGAVPFFSGTWARTPGIW